MIKIGSKLADKDNSFVFFYVLVLLMLYGNKLRQIRTFFIVFLFLISQGSTFYSCEDVFQTS